MKKESDEELKIKTALNMARIEFGKMMIDDSRGDQKMVDDGRRHIHDGFEAMLEMFGMGEPKANFPFKINDRILYSSRIRDKEGNVTNEIIWRKGIIESFGVLGYENRPQYIYLRLENGSSRCLDYNRGMDCIRMGKLKAEGDHNEIQS